MVIKGITDYLEYDTVSKIEYITEIPTKFPTISFCNINPLMTNASQQVIEDLLPLFGYASSMVITDFKELKNILGPAYLAALLNATDPSYGDENRKKFLFFLVLIMAKIAVLMSLSGTLI